MEICTSSKPTVYKCQDVNSLKFFLGPEFTKESTVEDEESDSGSDGERRRVRRERKVRSGTWMVGTGENLRVLGRQTCLVMRTLDRHAG